LVTQYLKIELNSHLTIVENICVF